MALDNNAHILENDGSVTPIPAEVMERFSPRVLSKPPRNKLQFLDYLNVFGTVRDIISDVLDYKYQIKLLEIEKQRITKEAEKFHHQIDTAREIALKVIDARLNTIEKIYRAASEELSRHHVSRMAVIETIRQYNQRLQAADVQIEERQLIYTSVTELSKVLVAVGEQGTVQLSILSQNTLRELEAAPRINGLLCY